jgi:zinc transport system permease protein
MVLEILEYGFIQRAMVSGVAISAICSSVGAFLVMRRLALFGDGIAHVAFGGIAAGLLAGVYPIWTALAVAVLGSIGLERLRNRANVSGEVAVAVTLVSGLSVGIILISISGGFTIDLFSFLFGSIVLVGTEDMTTILGISGAVLVLLCILYRRLLFITFNEELARISGIHTTALNYLFVALAAVVVVTAMRLTGILLVTALIVLPTITAVRFGRGFKATILISTAISASSVVCGIFASYGLDWAPSGTIVIILLACMGTVHLAFAVRDRRLRAARRLNARGRGIG